MQTKEEFAKSFIFIDPLFKGHERIKKMKEKIRKMLKKEQKGGVGYTYL